MCKFQEIKLQNSNGDALIEIEVRASKKGNMPAFSRPEFKEGTATVLELIYDEHRIEKFENEEAGKKLDELANDGFIKFNEMTYKTPHFTYEDITEKLILGGKAIKMESLRSQDHGLWSMSGRRKIEVSFDNTDCFLKTESVKSTKIRIVFNKLNGELCDHRDFCTEECELKGKKAVIELDTDMFCHVFEKENADRKRIKLGGYIEILCECGHGQEIRYKYPIELYVINTDPDVCDCVSGLPASIDLGTSSTCVAIERDNKNELLTLSPKIEDEDESETGNEYENPTNIMIYDWNAFYREWENVNMSAPIVSKGGKLDYLKSLKNPTESYHVEFDSGYSVKAILGSDDTDRKELNAILTLIKMIPYQILEEGEQLEINPYKDPDKFINIICGVEQQSDSHFNPVAFYGYLIGRAINDISKHDTIYTQFQITSPVMFDDEVKEVLRSSLEYGLSRSVPRKLRDSVEVTITHTEPVAYIGALCGTEYFQIDDDERKMFAVFDFGGGTLDFSYGIVSNEDELKIEVIKVGGRDNFGGETLIERLAYQIYLYNSILRDNMVPFVQPYGEELPDDVDERLVKKSDYAKANTNIVSAKIARRIFEGKLDAGKKDEESFKKLELYNMDGERKEFKVNYDVSELEEELRKIILDSVEDFAITLNDAFRDTAEKFDVNDVYIFKAGNSSRSRFVDEGMKLHFPENKHIQLVDQSTDDRKPKRYSITPKTAVAIGQLKLNRIEVVGDNDFFKFYVGFFNEGTGKFKIILDRSHNDGIWHKFRKVKNDALDIQYATSKPSDNSTVSRQTIKTADQKGKTIFVRIKDETTIEYCFVDSNDVSMIKDDAVDIYEMELR